MRFKTIIAIGALPLIASACAPVDPGYGSSVAYNKAAQIIDPEPVYTYDDAKPGENGERGAKAVERYRTRVGTGGLGAGAGGAGSQGGAAGAGGGAQSGGGGGPL